MELLLALSPLWEERQHRQGQRDGQGCRGGAQQLTAVHGTPTVSFHHRGFARDSAGLRLRGADVCAAAAAAGAAALIACEVRTKRSRTDQQPAQSREADAASAYSVPVCVRACVCAHALECVKLLT